MSDKNLNFTILHPSNITPKDLSEIAELFRQENWLEAYENEDHIKDMILKSFCFIAVTNDEKIIGAGQASSNYIRDAYLHNIVVHKDYQQLGLGKEIVRNLSDYCFANKIDWIVLIAAPGTQSFYEKNGFEVMPDYVPMVLRKTNP